MYHNLLNLWILVRQQPTRIIGAYIIDNKQRWILVLLEEFSLMIYTGAACVIIIISNLLNRASYYTLYGWMDVTVVKSLSIHVPPAH
jgi:hypothetical protein